MGKVRMIKKNKKEKMLKETIIYIKGKDVSMDDDSS